MTDCIFCKIIKGEIPSTKVYGDKETYAFLDINPINYGHVLVVPKRHSENLLEMNEKDMGSVMKTAQKIADSIMKGLNADGFNLGMNNYAAAGQLVMHSHIHVIPRFKNDGLKHWGSKKYTDDKSKNETAEKLKKFL